MHECGPQRECSVNSVNSVNAKVTSQTWKYEDLFRCRRTNSCPARAALVGTTMAAPAAAAQTAGYQPKLEKWDSDSDSDETDEEDLKV